MRSAVLTISLVAMFLNGATPSAVAQPASWDEQLHELGYLLVYASTINVVNGINLTADQAAKLRDLATQVKSVSLPRPDFTKSVPPDMRHVRETYLDLIAALRQNQGVGDELRGRVLKAREVESDMIRQSLQNRPRHRWDMRCAACHAAPQPGIEPDDLDRFESGKHRFIEERAHILMVYGAEGARELARIGREVDSILTPGQKAIFGDFSCCLVPPQDLSDPVRIGQADAPGELVSMLEKCREVGPYLWPWAKRRLLDRLLELEKVKRPDLSDTQAAEHRRRVETVLEKARGMSDVDFELSKVDLCKEINPKNSAPLPPQTDSFKRAYFLMTPGVVESYDRLVQAGAEEG